MKKFKEEFQSNQPSMRIGNRVPSGAVNLAFFDSPIISPDSTIQMFDRSNSIPENTEVLHIEHTDLFSDDQGRLRNSKGVYEFPISNIVITDTYYDPGGGLEPVPLYYVSNTRFNHYEIGITDTGTFEYKGQNIKIFEGDSETARAYRIFLTKELAKDTYSVTIYSEFMPSENNPFYIQYDKYDPVTAIVITNHMEFMNASPLFKEDTKQAVEEANPGDNIFHIEKTPDDKGFIFYVPSGAIEQDKNPIQFKWRVVKDGVDNGPWTITTLHNKDALQEIEYFNVYGKQIYFKQNNRAEKALVKPKDHFNGANGTYNIEVEVLGEDDRTVSLNPSGPTSGDTMIYAFTTDNTGTAESEVNEFSFKYDPDVATYTISAESEYEEYFTIPGKTTNVTKLSEGAVATSNAGSKGYSNYSDPNNAIDGVPPVLAFFGLVERGTNSFFAHTVESPTPDQNNATITVTLPTTRQVNDIEIRMGDKGSVVSATLKDESDSVLWTGSLTYQGNISDGSLRQRAWKIDFGGSPHQGVKTIEVEVKPDKWKTRDYWWLLELFGLRDLYRCGFDLHEINVYERIPPEQGVGAHKWSYEVEISSAVMNGVPYRVKISDILNQYPELVPPEDHRSSTAYTISNGNEDVNLYIRDGMLGPLRSSYEMSYEEASQGNWVIEASTEDYKVLTSYRYTVKTEGSDNIYIEQPSFKSFNEMWTLKINNGRIYLNDFQNNKVKEYYVPEFGTQAFDPQIPYKRVVDEQAQFIDNHIIQVSNKNLHVEVDVNGDPTNLTVTRNNVPVQVKDWNRFNGEIHLKDPVEFTDDILVSYTYEAKSFEYKGFAEIIDNTTPINMFYHLDLNPMPGHTYTYPLDETGTERPSSELLKKIVYIYIIPTYVNDNGEISGATGSTVRHYICDDTEDEITSTENILSEHPDALILAKILVRDDNIPENVIVMDSRRRGGGLSDKLTLESIKSLINDSDAIWDVTSWDGHPYPSNGVGIITLPKTILTENGGKFTRDQVRQVIDKHIAFGVYAIIRYK